MNPYTTTLLPSDIMTLLSVRIKLVRKKAKYSQSELAMRSGVSLGSIKRFEATGQISLESLLKLAHVLGRVEDFKNIFEIDDSLERVAKLFDN
jgi:transcriptional regulator with XRE-family HTH domain